MTSPESLLGQMAIAVATQDIKQILTLYEQLPDEFLERLNREYLSREQHIWLYALLAKWNRWKTQLQETQP